jgi:DNA damage-binding protein 1
MSAFNYVVSAQKATAVRSSVVCNFTSPDSKNLLIAKHNTIEMFQLGEDGLIKLETIVLHGSILAISVLSEAERTAQSLLVLTSPYHASILSYENGLVDTRQFTDLRDPSMRELDYEIAMAFDRCQRVAVLYIFAGHFKVIQFYPHKASIKQVYFVKADDDKVVSLAILGEDAVVKLAVLYEKETRRYVKVYDLPSEPTVLMRETHWSFYVSDGIPSKLLSLGDRLLVLTSSSALLYLRDLNTPSSVVHRPFDDISTAYQVDCSRVLVSNYQGLLHLVTILGNDLESMCLGRTACASTVSYLDNNYFYIGSRYGDSELIRVTDQAVGNAFFEVVQCFPNIGPILDMIHFQLSTRSNSSVITCSGAQTGGSLRYIRKGITVEIEAEVPIGKASEIWSLRGSGQFYDRLVVGYVGETRVLRLIDDSLKVEVTGDIDRVHLTLALGNCAGLIVQVTQEAVIELGADELTLKKRWTLHDFQASSFSLAKVGPSHCVVVADSSRMIVIDIGQGVVSSIDLNDDIACLEVSQELIAYSLWTDKSLHILSTAALHYVSQLDLIASARTADVSHVWQAQLESSVVPRSLLLTSIEQQSLLLCGLGDGKLVIYYLDTEDKSVVQVGSHALCTTALVFNGSPYVFVACESPVVLYSFQRKLLSTPVNISSASFVVPFYYQDSPECIAVVSNGQLQLMTIEDVQKLSIIQIPVGHTVRRLILLREYIVAIDGSVETANSLNLYSQSDFSLLHSYALSENERCVTITEVKGKLLMSSLTVVPGEQDGTPYLKVLEVAEDSLRQVSQIKLATHVFSINPLSENLFVGGAKNRLIVYELAEDRLVERSKITCHTTLLCMDTWDNFVLTGDLIKSVTLFKWSGAALEQVAKDFCIRYVTDIKIINAEFSYAADHFGNLFCLKVEGRKLKIVSCICLHDMINCLRSGTLNSYHRDQLYSQCLFGTVAGCLGAILAIPEALYHLLSELQTLMTKSASIGGLKHLTFRKLSSDTFKLDSANFIDGDLVETFLELSPAEQKAVCLQFARPVEAEELANELTVLQRHH